MPSYTIVSRARHEAKRWLRHRDYRFAAADTVAPLAVKELPKAMMSLPIGFIASHDDQFTLVAVQGLAPATNLFVAADGSWSAAYTPASYRGYPFALANDGQGRHVLCIDEDSGLVCDTKGEAFFNADGTASRPVAELLNFLTQVQASREAGARICAALHRHGLIQPWSIKLQSAQGERDVQGLYRIDEAALNELPPPAFLELRNAGALQVAYCQLLSMQHLARLGRLAQAHAEAAAVPLPVTPAGELDLSFLNDGGTIRLG